jgi:hypothetical protein
MSVLFKQKKIMYENSGNFWRIKERLWAILKNAVNVLVA